MVLRGKEHAAADWNLAETLLHIVDGTVEADRSVLILRDVHTFLSDAVIVGYLKCLARRINNGEIDFTIILLSPVVVIPPELEKQLTLLSMDYLTLPEIRKTISDFAKNRIFRRSIRISLTNWPWH